MHTRVSAYGNGVRLASSSFPSSLAVPSSSGACGHLFQDDLHVQVIKTPSETRPPGMNTLGGMSAA